MILSLIITLAIGCLCGFLAGKLFRGSGNGLIDTQTDVGGWPEYKGEASNDSDGDGMPDWFETQFGLNKTSASDASAKTLDKHGRYTNIEMYFHYLVRETVGQGNEKGNYTNL